MSMACQIASLLALGNAPRVEEALGPWLGMTPDEADAYAADPDSQDGLNPSRLHGLLLLLAARLPDPRFAPLIAALLHRCAPVAENVEDITTAMHLLSVWCKQLDADTFSRIVEAKRHYEQTFEALKMAGLDPDADDVERLLACLHDIREIDHAVVELGEFDLVIEMTSVSWIVGLHSAGKLRVMDMIPFGGRGRDPDPENAPDTGPLPRKLVNS